MPDYTDRGLQGCGNGFLVGLLFGAGALCILNLAGIDIQKKYHREKTSAYVNDFNNDGILDVVIESSLYEMIYIGQPEGYCIPINQYIKKLKNKHEKYDVSINYHIQQILEKAESLQGESH